MHKKKSTILFFLLIIIFSISCSNKLGYGVVNWSIPEYNLKAGDIIPIYVKSNIEKMYIVGLNDETKIRVTIPLWQLNFFETRKEANKFQSKMEKERYMYASVKLDRLPMRKSPENTAQQVYRLKKRQIVKVLWAAEDGVPVMKAGKALEGKWYEVLAEDGVSGWCFSYNLNIYDEREDLATLNKENEDDNAEDEKIKAILKKAWYPENYRKMINNKKINLNEISLTWGFFPGATSNIARIELNDIKLSLPYEKIVKRRNKYSFVGTDLYLQIRNDDMITLEFSDKEGKSHIENFVSLKISPEQIVDREVKRRNKMIEEIANTASEFSSGNFGKLKILSDGQFIWTGYNLLSPSIIPRNSGSTGKVYIKYFISKKINTGYDGAINFKFEQAKEPIIFMYEICEKGLRLESVDKNNIVDNIIERRNFSPLILFFAKN